MSMFLGLPHFTDHPAFSIHLFLMIICSKQIFQQVSRIAAISIYFPFSRVFRHTERDASMLFRVRICYSEQISDVLNKMLVCYFKVESVILNKLDTILI